MTRFDHRADGTPEAQWQPVLDALPTLTAPRADDQVVVLAAHPDDESLGAAGVMALAAAAGARVSVVVATDGENSHPDSPTHTPAQLARRRRAETCQAVSAVSPNGEVRFLGLPDGRLAERQSDLTAALREVTRDATHLLTPWAGDRHPDHAACARAGAELDRIRHWQYPIWAWHWGGPSSVELPRSRMHAVRLDEAAQAKKAEALACHVSQYAPLSDAAGDEPILGETMLEHFRRDSEVFILGKSLSREDFDGLYAHRPDPWSLGERFYEIRKRSMLLAALTRSRFGRAFEPGCATGLLTEELARRCDELIAWDVADAAVAQTSIRLGGAGHVTVRRGSIPDQWPPGSFDLIVLSEVGYYCADLIGLAERVEQSLAPAGVLVACHWRHPAPLHPHTAAAVHDALDEGRQLVVSHVEEDFLLHAWTRSGASVAAEENIIR